MRCNPATWCDEGLRKLPNETGRDTRGGEGVAEGIAMDEGTYVRMVRENASNADGSLERVNSKYGSYVRRNDMKDKRKVGRTDG